MEIAVIIPEGHSCITCPFLSFNYVEVSNGLKRVHVYCRIKRLVWESDSTNVMKHDDCPSYDIDKMVKDVAGNSLTTEDIAEINAENARYANDPRIK